MDEHNYEEPECELCFSMKWRLWVASIVFGAIAISLLGLLILGMVKLAEIWGLYNV